MRQHQNNANAHSRKNCSWKMNVKSQLSSSHIEDCEIISLFPTRNRTQPTTVICGIFHDVLGKMIGLLENFCLVSICKESHSNLTHAWKFWTTWTHLGRTCTLVSTNQWKNVTYCLWCSSTPKKLISLPTSCTINLILPNLNPSKYFRQFYFTHPSASISFLMLVNTH